MKVTYNWLRELSTFPVGPDELAAVFTRGGLEVEGVEHPGRGLEPARVAQVVSRDKHPNADRLCFAASMPATASSRSCAAPPISRPATRSCLAFPHRAAHGSKLTKSKIPRRGVQRHDVFGTRMGLSPRRTVF
jgi:phenylalanyl-tRNA synthetase beta chain